MRVAYADNVSQWPSIGKPSQTLAFGIGAKNIPKTPNVTTLWRSLSPREKALAVFGLLGAGGRHGGTSITKR